MTVGSSLTRLSGHLLVMGLALAPSLGSALTSDREQPIKIVADRAEADDQSRIAIYRGDVVITQGTMRITGETVWIYYDENKDITKLVSQGEPAHFRQLPDGKQDFETADANRMEYYTQQDLIFMKGNARYGQGSDSIRAEEIVYDTLRSRMRAQSGRVGEPTASTSEGSEEKPRVHITITPKKTPKKQ